MAAPPSKNPSSCSPIQSRPTNPRNSEVSNPIRRSFTGSPFPKPSIIANQRPGFNPNTPANSPSGYPRRNSIGRENIVVSLRDSEDKENSKDQNLKQDRIRSPASSKGTKNFMSPTIAATSKINASPRKKILTERNEPIRTSVSFSDGKSPLKEDLNLKSEKGLNQKKEVSFDPIITYMEDKEPLESNEDFDSLVNSSTKEDWDWSSESVTMANDCVNLDPSFKISPRASCSLPSPALAPLDADPSMPPYDPKTNYLSPRPQFLHYKPNPRIELYLKKGRDGKQLEESFASESSSDTEFIEEETVSDDSQKESKDASSGDVVEEEEEELLVSELNPIHTSERSVVEAKRVAKSSSESSSDTEVTEEETVSDDSQKESEDASSGDVVEEEEEEEEELLVSEPNPIHTSERTIVEAKRVAKSNFFTRTKFTALLLILASACLWASLFNSSIMEPSVINNLSFSNPYVPPEISEYIRDNVKGLAQRFRQWVYESLSYICNMIISFKERHKPVPLKFVNLTTLLEDGLVDNYLLVDHGTCGIEIKYESNELVPTIEGEVDIESSKQEEDQPIEADENVEEIIGGGNYEAVQNIEEVVERDSSNDKEFEDQEVIAAHDNFDVSVDHIVPESEEVNVPQAVVTEPGNLATEVTQERVESSGYIDELQSNADIIDQPIPIPQAAEIQLEVSDSRQSVAQNDMSSAEIKATIAENKQESFDSDTAMKNPENTESESESESVEMTLNGIKNLFSAQIMMGISLFSLSLISAAAYIYMKNRTSTTPNAKISIDQVPLTKKLDLSPLLLAIGHTVQERTSSRNWQTDVETVGESCPSEMSSFQYSSSSYYSKKGTSEAQSQEKKPKKNSRRESLASSDYSTESPSYGSFTTYEKISSKHGNGDEGSSYYSKKGTSEAQSLEKKPKKNSRRESLASSDYSTESPSYGSFTTYEKISSKHGNGDEVSFTPVRRSSRIRSQVTSP